MSLEKSDSHRFLPGNIRNGIRRLLHPAHLGGSGTIPGGAHKIHQKSSTLWARERAAYRTGRPVVRLLHKAAQKWQFARFFVVVRSFTGDGNLLQPTGGVNSTHHTSHFLVDLHLMTRTRAAQVVSLACAPHISSVIFMRSCCVFDSPRLHHFPLFAVYLLSYRPVFPPGHQLHLPRCEGQIPCALQPVRTLALLPSTTLSQVMSPTTTTSRRLLNRTSRNPPARTGPWMTSSTVTTPSALRSLHHCSSRSEKIQRAVDELITLMTKVCRPVSRRLSVIELGDLLWNSLTHKSQTSEKIHFATQMSKSGFFWHDKKSRLSLTVKQRFKNTSSKPTMTEEVSKSWMKLSSLNEEKFIVLIKETNNIDEIINLFMNNYTTLNLLFFQNVWNQETCPQTCVMSWWHFSLQTWFYSIHVRCAHTEVRLFIVQLSCVCLWTSWRRKTNNREDSDKEETVLVYRCQYLCYVQSVTCLNWKNLHPCSTADAALNASSVT